MSVRLLALAMLLLACRGEGPPRVTIAGVTRDERCLSCHGDTRGLGDVHAPERIGCSVCHLGDPRAATRDGAHRGIVRTPGELDRVLETCGQAGCHGAEALRVLQSPMAGAPGILAVDRFAFGERTQPVVLPQDDLRQLGARAASPAEDHVRKLCASCHLAAPKRATGDLGFAARGGGCTACHLAPPVERGGLHPAVSADVSERRCEGCHARSGRISLSFRGLAEVEPGRGTERLPDGRPVVRAEGDVHAGAGLTCVDCHSERDLMGDGSPPGHARDAVEVRCDDCHADVLRQTGGEADAVAVAERLARAWLRRGGPSLTGRKPVVMARGTPLYRTDAPGRNLLLAASGQRRPLPARSRGPEHTMAGHARLACQACHAAWAPRCPRCHTVREGDASAFDHLAQRETPGRFDEHAGANGLGPPALALDGEGRIGPFVEGMDLRLSGLPGGPVERTLWAPLDPHTTGRARPCASCHPGDTRTYPAQGETTRVGARRLDAAERERIARVGPCIACHAGYEDPIYRDFAASFADFSVRSPGTRPCRKARDTR